ncbi:FMN-linked oxidoreductase [Apiospora rasikravindrae]|uniref:FMN-linked oxidoreductase n=1 Tax=Apiospora rasikravindrae TaxID=990691 RepID=A0ABR1TEM3_9PEZI
MADRVPRINISPPLLNSACPWATTWEDLEALFRCSFTGAITIRTSLLEGFRHDPDIHQYTFFDPVTQSTNDETELSTALIPETASLNTLGYSPIPLETYLSYISDISGGTAKPTNKLIIISVTGTPDDVAECYRFIAKHSLQVNIPLAMEVNLSCPNIPNAPPPAYSGEALSRYLTILKAMISTAPELPRIPFGLKMPPYTYADQFKTLMSALTSGGTPCPVSFLTATNTLGSCLVLADEDGASGKPRLAGLGLGGMAGAPLHPLALGNVSTLRRMLDESDATKHVDIIGVGGVEDGSGYGRMRGAGAAAVGLATALGRKGLKIFEEIGLSTNHLH